MSREILFQVPKTHLGMGLIRGLRSEEMAKLALSCVIVTFGARNPVLYKLLLFTIVNKFFLYEIYISVSMTCRPMRLFLLMCVFHDVRHVEFRGLTGSQRTPRFWGVTYILMVLYYLKTLCRPWIFSATSLSWIIIGLCSYQKSPRAP